MMRACTKDEVVQVAQNLLHPLLEGMHQDVANLRAELVAEGRARAEQDARISRLMQNREKEIQILRAELARLHHREPEWNKTILEAKQVREQNTQAIAELQRSQAKYRAALDRIDKTLIRILGDFAEK